MRNYGEVFGETFLLGEAGELAVGDKLAEGGFSCDAGKSVRPASQANHLSYIIYTIEFVKYNFVEI